MLEEFHPTVRTWFRERLGEPTPPQARGWPAIRSGRNVLIAAPTGSGKTLAAFLWGIDALLREGEALPDETRVLYVSPLRALSNDVRKNLHGPLAELRERDPSLPDVRVLVRTGDTPQRERAAMRRRPPHILVTTPESLYILLTSEGGRELLKTVRTAIVDEIHAVLGDKRGAHLALSLERLDDLAGGERERGIRDVRGRGIQRIGLSATQKPLEEVGRFLVGKDRECELIDEGHLRDLDLAIELPQSPLETLCSHETWGEIYGRIGELVRQHRTTLVFVGTRKLAERAGAELGRLLGEERVTCHHSSLAKDRRLDAEQRLKEGKLSALVATASLELGIDIGDVDLAVQIGSTRTIANFLQRVGRSGHGVDRVPKGRIFPLTRDELVECAALLRAVRAGVLDRTPQPSAPLDVLAQQIVAACATGTWSQDELHQRLRRAWPYRDLERSSFDALVELHARGRYSLLHRDGVRGRLRGTRRARLAAILSGGAIPDRADYQVVLEPEGTPIGTIDEDFAIESSAGDVFQLGTASWRVLKVERGTMRVADARGAPPSLPFWFGEAPARSAELSGEVARVREGALEKPWIRENTELDEGGVLQLGEYVAEGAAALGAVPTVNRFVLERFFDESGGMQLVLHAPLGGRVNRALGLALRKRFCRRFGFELQAAANEDAIVLSLGPQHSFPLEEVFDYLHPDTVRDVLVQAVLPTPMFATRWRWNVCRALWVERARGGKRVPAPILRMRADDRLAEAFPDVVACGENLPAGDVEVPMEHPLVAQTIEDCLHEAMDVDGLVDVLRRLRSGEIERVAVDVPEPSAFARSILNARPYAFLDDAPLEERRTQAVLSRRVLDTRTADEIGHLDPRAVERVREEAWPRPVNAEEVHEALLWMGYVSGEEAAPWSDWLAKLASQGRVASEGGRWFAAEATRDPKEVLRGRLEALGPVAADDPSLEDAAGLLAELEAEGAVLRARLDGRWAWCDRRLLARIQRTTLEGLRREIEPVPATTFLAFLARWQHVAEGHRLEGPAGVRAAVEQLAGYEVPAGAWERKILAARVHDFRPTWLDELGLRGEVAWGRLWGGGRAALRAAPIAMVPRRELRAWLDLARVTGADAAADASRDAEDAEGDELSWKAGSVLERLRRDGPSFAIDLEDLPGLLPSNLDEGLAELAARGRITADAFGELRRLLTPLHRRRRVGEGGGRWSVFRDGSPPAVSDARPTTSVEFVARVLLRRWGVVFRALLERERLPVRWRDLLRVLRALELRGDVRGGRFVARFAGEQYALPEAVDALRRTRRETSDGESEPLQVAAADPLNLVGILTPDVRIPISSRQRVSIG